MQSFDIRKFLPHLIIIGILAAAALLYSYPQLQGKVLQQGDVISFKAMSKENMDWHDQKHETVLWMNNMFSGMPGYTIYIPDASNYVFYIQDGIVKILGKPASFFFIAMVCFFMLMRVMRVDRWLAVAGAFAFAFSTYNMGLITSGHETKLFDIAYFPAVLGGLILVYRGDRWRGILMLGLSLALMICNTHYQIIYYAMMVIVFAVVGFFIVAIREGKLKQFFIASAVSAAIAVVAIGPTLSFIMPTLEYNKTTMRGGQSELTITKHDTDKKSGGLDKEYAFRWSNGIGETFCLIVPYLYGGSSSEPAEKAEKTNELTGGQYPSLPLYWGDQPFLAGPIYFGAVICFLFVLGMMIVRSPHKWWMFAVTVLSIVMSWGRHFPELNYFLFDHLPMFNKFRIPSMILTIAQVLFPVIGIMAVQEIINGEQDKKVLLNKLKMAAGITAGLCLLLAFGGSMFFDYSGVVDAKLPKEILSALKEDRASVATKSGITSAVYILLAAGILWAFLTDKLKSAKYVMLGIGALVTIDLVATGSNFLNENNYVEASEAETELQPRPVDEQIMQDKTYYRVLDLTKDVYNDATQAAFHHSIGGYSPAKMEQYQDLIDVHMSSSFNAAVLNMLNTKYIIFNGNGNQPQVSGNPDACGNAWFVNEVKWTNTADEEILALNAGKLGDTAVVANAFNPKQTAVMRASFKDAINGYAFGKDSAASITLTKYSPDKLEYMSKNSQNGLAVMSEIYYPHGWTAYVDGKETPIMKANYVLRAIKVPAGEHKIEFRFHPDSYYKSDKISMISSILIYLLSAFCLYKLFKSEAKA